jgi:hypothetical protein
MRKVMSRQFPRSSFINVFAVLFPLLLLWSLSNPMFAAPDEPAHLLRAQGFSQFDFSSPYQTDGLPLNEIDCLRFNADVTADCMNLVWEEPWNEFGTSTDGYPPLLHALAALPNAMFDGLFATYATRVWLAIVNIALLSWAAVISLRRGTWALTGLMLGITPMVVFTMATVNPSGLSAAGAALFVTGIASLGQSSRNGRQRLLPIWTGVGILILTRRDGALWAALIAAVAYLPHVSPRQLFQRLVSSSKTRRAVVTAIPVVIASLFWAVPWMARFVDRRASAERSTWQAIRALRIYLDHLMGTFGWLDSTMGIEAFLISIAITGYFVILAVSSANRQHLWSIATSLMLLAVVPVAFGTIRYPYFQGRYLIPMWIAAMVLAGHSLQSSRESLNKIGIRPRPILLAWLGVHVWSLLNNLKRYTTGRNGSWDLFDSEVWHPPMMSNVVTLALFAVSTALLARAVFRIEQMESFTPLREAVAKGDGTATNLQRD